jgi:hypothetical protein
MDMLLDVLNSFKKFGGFVGLILSMGRLCLCGCKGLCDINGTQWLKFQPHLKGTLFIRAMKIFVVVVLNIGETLIPSAWIFGVVNA